MGCMAKRIKLGPSSADSGDVSGRDLLGYRTVVAPQFRRGDDDRAELLVKNLCSALPAGFKYGLSVELGQPESLQILGHLPCTQTLMHALTESWRYLDLCPWNVERLPRIAGLHGTQPVTGTFQAVVCCHHHFRPCPWRWQHLEATLCVGS